MCMPCLKHVDDTTENTMRWSLSFSFPSVFILTFPFSPFVLPPFLVGKKMLLCIKNA